MKQTLLNLRTSLWLLTLPIVVLMIIAFMTITGCDEAGMVEPVVPVDNGTELEPVEPVEPTTEPTEPTTNGDVKKPEEPIEPVEGPPAEGDFVGWVYTPEVQFATLDNGMRHAYTGRHRDACAPVQGVIVAIVGSGKKTATNKEGRYIFRNVQEDNLHLRTQKSGFEPKEVMVYRSGPTALIKDGDVVEINYERGIQKTPGTILIGLRWPEPIRPILQSIAVINDTLCIKSSFGGNRGFFIKGICAVRNLEDLDTFAHEIAHAHQDALLDIDQMGATLGSWDNTPEGKAFIEARQKDWNSVGKADYDTLYFHDIESAAETCARYWWTVLRWKGGVDRKLEKNAPNRFKWAEKWVTLEK